MSTGYKIGKDDSAYYLTFQVVGWVDLFTRQVYRDIVVESIKFCQANKGLNLFAYVIMSNHVHLLAQSEQDNLSGFVRDFKNYTSKKFLEVVLGDKESRREWMKVVFAYHGKLKNKQTYQIWTHESHAEHVFSQKFIEQKVNYIHQNPVRNGLVANAEDYLYSSARCYAGMSGPLEVIPLDFTWKTYR